LVLGVAAIIVVGATAVLVLQEDTAPVGGTVLNYADVAATAEREGGEYVIVPEPVASYTDTSVGIREGTAGATPGTSEDLEAMQQKAGMAEAGVTGVGGAPATSEDLGAMQQKAELAEAGVTGLGGGPAGA
jgi:hypothetical protein